MRNYHTTDLTFFTNEQNQTLLDRFKANLKDTALFDVLVGYFRASGFAQLSDSIASTQKTRILIGIGTDSITSTAIEQTNTPEELPLESHKNTKATYRQNLIAEIDNTKADDAGLEKGIRQFIELTKQKRLEIRAFPSRDIHAKVYIGRFAESDRDFGYVITGSSNFSYAGLVGNREFNVELKQRHDVEFALAQFEQLWHESVEVTDTFVDTINNNTWLSNTITPYELYLKLIYEYLQEDINLQDSVDDIDLPDGFMPLAYQRQAVQQALKKLREYNGVFLADVVGLGKTFIAAQLLQQVRGKILVICPPALQDYWNDALQDFRVSAKIESLGKLESVQTNIYNTGRTYSHIVVDEAHRFRNDSTQSYAHLLEICRNKKVILITATALNNRIDDIAAQLGLFQKPKQSTIPGVPNLEQFFNNLKKQLKGLEKDSPEYQQKINSISTTIREKVLKHVMVRRTRTDVITYFKQDIEQQGLKFPQVQAPARIVYQFRDKTETTFSDTITQLKAFQYARYTPLLYYTGDLSDFERQQQKNIGGFMRTMLIKRLESSFYAFKQTIGRFIDSYDKFIAMYHKGTVYISKAVDVYDLLDNDSLEILENLVTEKEVEAYSNDQFKPAFIDHLNNDFNTLKQIKQNWNSINDDPKLARLIDTLQQSKQLKHNKPVIFTESRETGSYLFDKLKQEFANQVLFYSSDGGQTVNGKHAPAAARTLIKQNFDPNNKQPQNNINLLITTDVLAEGINLHRSNSIINYDLPWNPARVMQRVGRVNRLGTQHREILICNFFPTSQADEHLQQETSITNKIKLFHNMMGEDAQYLTEGEQIASQQLFDALENPATYNDENGEPDSELKYLQIIRNLRDHQPELFARIKQLPKKARTGRKVPRLRQDALLTFIRIGALKKFYVNSGNEKP